jgi:hypothetical protein
MTSPALELERLQAELAAEERERVEAGLCACGCGERLPVKRHGRRRYVAERHRQRRHQERLEREAELLGVPTRLSLNRLEQYMTTSNRPSDAQTPRTAPKRRRPSRRPGVSVYLPRPELAELVLEALEYDVPASEHPDREEALADAVDAVRRALQRRRARDERASRPTRPAPG